MWKCKECGACCYFIDKAKKMGYDFPYKANKDGSCEKLVDNRCSIYETRPDICNVEKVRRVLGMEYFEYYELMEKSCEEVRRSKGVK